MISPRFYQLQAIDAVIQRFSAGVTRQLISLATGLGKTVCFGLLARKLDKRTVILAHREELLEQAAEKVRLIWPGVSIGILKAERDEVDAQVVIASIQSAARPNRLARLSAQGFGLCVVDEAHHATADSYKTVLNGLGFLDNDPQKLLLGVTATPRRADGSGLDEIFQEIAFHMGIKEGIDRGFLSPLIGRQILSKVDLRGVGSIHGDFNSEQLSKAINTPSRNDLIVDSYARFAQGRKKALAFCADRQHCEDIDLAFKAKGIAASVVHGAMRDELRKQTLSDFARGKVEVLINCNLLIEGFDQPDVDTLLLCRPTQSEPFYVQMVGRATRLHPAKSNALILDFVDNCSRHKLSSFATLEGAIKVEHEERGEGSDTERERGEKNNAPVEYAGDREINFFEERQFAWIKIGPHWHLRLSADSGIWIRQREDDDKFDAIAYQSGQETSISTELPLGFSCGSAEDWVRRQPNNGFARRDANWRNESATPRQIEMLIKFGFKVDGEVTKGQAALLLDTKFSEPATPRQISWLKKRGVEFPGFLTKLAAKRLIAGKLKR